MPRKKTEEEKTAVAIPPKMRWASTPHPRYIHPQTFDPVTGAAHPYQITDEGLKVIYAEAQKGSTLGSIAQLLGINATTFGEMRKRDTRTQEAFTAGRAAIVTRLSHVLVNKALEGNTVELLFALKTIGGFREGVPVEGAPQVNVNISIPAPLPANQVERIIGRIEVQPDATDVEPIAPEPVEPFE